MRIVRFKERKKGVKAKVGSLFTEKNRILDLSDATDIDPDDPLARYDLNSVCWKAAQEVHAEAQRAGNQTDLPFIPLSEAQLLAPVARPGKVIAIGLNYRDHAVESNLPIPERPVVFSKFSTAVVGPEDDVKLPLGSSQVDYEAELAVVIGRRAVRATRDDV